MIIRNEPVGLNGWQEGSTDPGSPSLGSGWGGESWLRREELIGRDQAGSVALSRGRVK